MDSYEINFDELARNIPARSESEYDGEYLQLNQLSKYVNKIEGPEDLEITLGDYNLSQLGWEGGNNEIFDKDGDGVEDNVSDGW